MGDKKIIEFFEKFKNFKPTDENLSFTPGSLTTIFSWVDELKEDLFADDFKLVTDIIKRTEDTPFVEFSYAWKYLRNELLENLDYLNNTNVVKATEAKYYELQNLFTFIFSLLNKITMINYVDENEDYFVDFITELKNEGATDSFVANSLRNKLKRVTFANWRYNKKLPEYENSYLWANWLKEIRNTNEHYGELFRIGDIDGFKLSTFNFYLEIIFSIYLFLYYLEEYLEAFIEKEKAE